LIRLYDRNLQFVESTLRQQFTEAFGVESGISFDKSNNSNVLYKRSKEVWNRLHDLGVPAGRKARIIVIPDHIKSSDDITIKSSFISGVFDAEGSLTSFSETDRHPRGYHYFEVKMYSPRFIEGLRSLLLDVSCEFRPRVYHYGYGSILRLNGRKQLSLVSSRLNLMHPRFNPPAR
jgi:DNA-binding transcriptional regulator WhiA